MKLHNHRQEQAEKQKKKRKVNLLKEKAKDTNLNDEIHKKNWQSKNGREIYGNRTHEQLDKIA